MATTSYSAQIEELNDALALDGSTLHSEDLLATPCPNAPAHRLGIQRNGSVYLLIASTHADGQTHAAETIRLKQFEYSPDVSASVVDRFGKKAQLRCSVFRLISNDPDLIKVFCSLAELVVGIVGVSPTVEHVSAVAFGLRDLFAPPTQGSKRSLKGLWGELLLMAASDSPGVLIESWHADGGELFDFNSRGLQLEVKASVGTTRKHHFLLSQLRPFAPEGVLVCSCLLTPSPIGKSVFDLAAVLLPRLQADSPFKLKVLAAVADASRHAPNDAESMKYDPLAARQSLRFYKATDIPSVQQPVDARISDVEFWVVLDGCHEQSPANLEKHRGLWAAANPIHQFS